VRSYVVQMAVTTKEKLCVRVPKQDGERVRRELKELDLVDENYKIEERRGLLYIPVKEKTNDFDYELTSCALKPRQRTLRKRFGIRYDVIGDIAIINWFDGVLAVAAELLETRRGLNVVLGATSGVTGQYRLKDLVFVAGERRTETVHKEYGSRLHVDVASAYFSPRLATERHRIAELAQSRETVVDMFAGVGPFTVLLAKKVKKGIAFEKNPTAFRCLCRNIELNKLDNVEARCGSAKDLAPNFRGTGDRIIMNLPHSSFMFLYEAVTILNERGGFIHYYDAKPESEFPRTVERVKEAIGRLDRTVEQIRLKKVRSYAPRQYHIALDLEVSPL
jgi:tRNA (guanine37-N1)-methyltransferase